jgi:hypothetical protein
VEKTESERERERESARETEREKERERERDTQRSRNDVPRDYKNGPQRKQCESDGQRKTEQTKSGNNTVVKVSQVWWFEA